MSNKPKKVTTLVILDIDPSIVEGCTNELDANIRMKEVLNDQLSLEGCIIKGTTTLFK